MSAIITDLQSGTPNATSYDVLNMLNMKYVKFGDAAEQVIPNTKANGSAWFVSEIKEVNSPNEEIDMLGAIDTKSQAVVDVSKFSLNNDSFVSGEIQLVSKTLNEIVYSSSSTGNGFGVFSEIFYPKGWSATIDGNKAEIVRANYVLRALEIPAGEHEIKFTYSPKIYSQGNTIMTVFGIMFYLCLIASAFSPMILKGKS